MDSLALHGYTSLSSREYIPGGNKFKVTDFSNNLLLLKILIKISGARALLCEESAFRKLEIRNHFLAPSEINILKMLFLRGSIRGFIVKICKCEN